MKRRVVITGMGAITPCGNDVDTFWKNVKNGNSGIDTIQDMNLEEQAVHIGGEIKDFDIEKYMDLKEAKRTDKYCQYAIAAAKDALEDSGLNMANEDEYRVGVIVGSAAGGFRTFEVNHTAMINRGMLKCSPFTVPMLINNIAAGKIAIKIGAKGVNKAIVTACATAAHSIGDAFRSIQYGDADVIFAGGAEATVCGVGIASFTVARTLSKRNDEPQKASRPYDKDRDGFVMSEGAGILVLEELEHAKNRGAKIYAEIVGYGQTADAHDIVAPDPEGNSAAKAMELALENAGVKPEVVDYINTHGTSTGLGDMAESLAVAKIFGDLSVNKNLLVSSTKSVTGHSLGASGGFESIICIKSINDSIVPPTINLENQDENVANLNYVPNKAIETNVDYALTNSFGFGGHNASLLFKKYKD